MKKSHELRDEIEEELTEAQTLLYERYRAQRRLPELVVHNDTGVVPAIAHSPGLETLPRALHTDLDLVQSPRHTLAEIDAQAAQLTDGGSCAVVMQSTATWLADLYEHWTTSSQDNVDYVSDRRDGERPIEGPIYPVPKPEGMPQDFKHSRRDDRLTPGAGTVHNLPVKPAPTMNPHPPAQISFGGGSEYDDCVATLTLSNIWKELSAVNRKILVEQIQGLPITEIREQRLPSMQVRRKILEERRKIHDLGPPRKDHLHKLENAVESYDSLLRRSQVESAIALSSEDWTRLKGLDEDEVPRLKTHLDRLHMSRDDYQIWREYDRVMMGSSKCCPDIAVTRGTIMLQAEYSVPSPVFVTAQASTGNSTQDGVDRNHKQVQPTHGQPLNLRVRKE